jgi:chromosome segregation ATPase
MNSDRHNQLEERRQERRSDYIRLEATLNEVSEQLQTFKKRFDEVEEVLVSIRSLAKTLQMIERLAVWIAKVGAVVGMGYAVWKFILSEIFKSVKSGS